MHMSFKKIKKLAIMAIASLAVMPAAGQDLLANQAPIDRKMKVVDSLMLQQLITNEVWEWDQRAQMRDRLRQRSGC